MTEVRPEDGEQLYKWINNSVTVRYNAPYRPVTKIEHEAWIQGIGKSKENIHFAIRIKEPELLIGTIQLFDIHYVHRSAELALRIGEQTERGKGYGSEALQLIVDFSWRDLNLQRLWLRVFTSNERAIRVYKRAGFNLEGTLKRSAWIDGNWEDQYIMALLK